MQKLVVPIAGLHCKACEVLTEDKLKELKNIKEVDVNNKAGVAEIKYVGDKPSLEEIDANLKTIGYKIAKEEDLGNKQSTYDKIINIFSFVAIAIIFYWLLNRSSFLDLGSIIQGGFSWPLAVLVGLIAGVSSCLALVGGLVFGLSANYAKNHPEASKGQKFFPHLLFNLGRVGGFFALGGILGLLGSTFKISVFANSILTIFVGLVLLILGLKLLDIFPKINRLEITLPKKFAKTLKVNDPIMLGALTFFLPCGFTQAMQIYALGSGNFWQGGLIMALFAIGTAPGLLSVGGLTSLLDKRKSKMFFQAAGAIVVVFALFNLNNGLNLLKVSTSFGSLGTVDSVSSAEIIPNIELEDGVRILRMEQNSRGYKPNRFVILKDQPVRWIIDTTNQYSCASSLVVPSLSIQKQLTQGENIIEFTPTKLGNIRFSCSMGMYNGVMKVVDSKEKLSTEDLNSDPVIAQASADNSCNGSCGGGCGGGSCTCEGGSISENTSSGSCH